MQQTLIIGHLGNDPDVRILEGGTTFANFSVASKRTWTKDGEKKEHTEWHRCVSFGKQAEIIGKYLKKGSHVYIEGYNKTNKYEKEGQTHYSTEVHVLKFEFLDSKGSSNNTSAPAPADDFGDEIPF